MKNLYLQVASWWRYIFNTPPKTLSIQLGEVCFQENFQNKELFHDFWHDNREWGSLHDDAPQNGENFATSPSALEFTKDGLFINTVDWSNFIEVDFTVGCIWSKVKFPYGYYEVTCVLDDNYGQWNAPLWLFESSDGKTREIDVCEFYIDDKGARANSNAHFYGDNRSARAKSHKLRNITGRDVRFGVMRLPNYAEIYYDGHLVREMKIDTQPKMPVIIGSGVKYFGLSRRAEEGSMLVKSFKFWKAK